MNGASNCHHPTEDLEFSNKIWAWGLLTDWRYWALGVGLSILFAVISGVANHLGWSSGYLGAVPLGGGLGFYAAMSMRTIRKCTRCQKIVRLPFRKPASQSRF